MSTNGSTKGGGSAYDSAGNGQASLKDRKIRERLERDAERVTESDIENLNDTMPKKLRNRQLNDLKDNFGWVREMVGRATTLFDLLRDKGFKLSGKSKTLIAAGLIYLVLPTDLVPDFIPGLGYIDDALVLSTLWKVLETEIEAYLAHRQHQIDR